MKMYGKRLRDITISSFLCLMIYVATYWISGAFLSEADPASFTIIWGIYSVALMALFSFLLIHRLYIKNGSGEECVLEDYESGYLGLWSDMKLIFQRERMTVLCLFFVNAVCWGMLSLDKLIFSKRTFSAIFIIYAPLNIISISFPDWANSVLGYLFGAVICSGVYLFELVLFRKKWYQKWHKNAR